MTTLTMSPPVAAPAQIHFVARQPILDKNSVVYGHELIFNTDNDPSGIDDGPELHGAIDAAMQLISVDTKELTFTQCNRASLLSGLVTLLPPSHTVIELEGAIEPDQEFLACCRSLKEAGYRFAVDGLIEDSWSADVVDIAAYIKVDFVALDAPSRREIYSRAASKKIIVAKGIETETTAKIALSEGCELFQGYFFCEPVRVAPRVVPQNHLIYMRLLAELTRKPANLREIEQLTMSEPSICYRLLRLVNSVLYGLPNPVSSIGTAVMLIGDNEFRKLVTVAIANVAATTKSKAATRVALERAKFCELLAPTLKEDGSAMYLLGMLSLMDVILAMPMKQVLKELPLHPRICAALTGQRSALRVALDLARAREGGGWIETTSIQESIGLPGVIASRLYSEAVQWADKVYKIDA